MHSEHIASAIQHIEAEQYWDNLKKSLVLMPFHALKPHRL